MHSEHDLAVNETTTYLNSAQVRARYGGVSDMALWRWLRDQSLDFPKPIRINRRRFWRASDLVGWELGRARVAGPAS